MGVDCFGLIPFLIFIPLFLIAFKPLWLTNYLIGFNIFWFACLTIGTIWMSYGVFKGNLTFWGNKDSVISGWQELFFFFSLF